MRNGALVEIYVEDFCHQSNICTDFIRGADL